MTSTPPVSLKHRLRAWLIRFRTGTNVSMQGHGHRLCIAGARLFGCKVEVEGHGNTLMIHPQARLWETNIKLTGDNLTCTIGDHCVLRGITVIVEDSHSRLLIKRCVSGTGCRLLAGEGGLVEIGEDCMMSVGADVRNTDGHSVVDLASGARINPAADVRLGDHVWLGLGAKILKGVRIGEHSIAAAGSVVVADVPSNTIVAGVPARPIRSGITWERARLPTQAREWNVNV